MLAQLRRAFSAHPARRISANFIEPGHETVVADVPDFLIARPFSAIGCDERLSLRRRHAVTGSVRSYATNRMSRHKATPLGVTPVCPASGKIISLLRSTDKGFEVCTTEQDSIADANRLDFSHPDQLLNQSNRD